MKCPHCKKELKVLDRCWLNAESYHNTVLAHTECCNKGVYIEPITIYKIRKYTGTKKHDDWGILIN